MTPDQRGAGPRTLVVHTGGIGDLLLACPALARLAEDGPIELLGRPERLALAVAAGIAESAYPLEQVGFDSALSSPSPALRTFLRRFERAVVWMKDDDGVICGNLRECGVRDAAAFPGIPPADWAEHASRYYASCLGCGATPSFRLELAPASPGHDVVIHPGSGGHRKNWPVEHFAAVASALERQGRHTTWCVGPAEDGMHVPSGASVLEGRSLIDLAHELASARLYIGNDSGITHLAAAAGCPTVAVFGPTDPRVWAPLGGPVTVVSASPWPPPEAVLAAVEGPGR
ncbi:MAG: glycosyltransferase family 9 protein [Candidatus Hydrogenedentes bacterium]|nr:glycosyltransferase family 9 protein [Candidatus Hydrogenedentota bacterium]